MYNFKNILKHKDLLEDFISRISEDYEDDLEEISRGYHFCPETLEESGIIIKYCWSDICNIMKGLSISFPECVTESDIVYTVNYLYSHYFPIISDLPGSLRVAEKYIKDPDWPDHDKPYRLYYDKYRKDL